MQEIYTYIVTERETESTIQHLLNRVLNSATPRPQQVEFCATLIAQMAAALQTSTITPRGMATVLAALADEIAARPQS